MGTAKVTEARWLSLRRSLAREGGACASLEEMREVAAARNDEFATPLPAQEIERLVCDTWDAFASGRLTRWIGGPAQGVFTDAIVNAFASSFGKRGSDCFMFWAKMVVSHSARLLRGETFQLRIDAMVASRTIPGWNVRRYEETRNALLAAGVLKCVTPAMADPRGGRFPAEYVIAVPRDMDSTLKGPQNTETSFFAPSTLM